MHHGRSELDRVVDVLRGQLRPDQIIAGAAAADEIGRRTLNPIGDASPRYLLRPRNTEECRIIIERLASIGCYPTPIASLTTFWEPYSAVSGVALDTLGLRDPSRVDSRQRIGYFGAGTTVREIDRLARSQGLCLIAYPDSDGSASIGSMAAVACTTGLGMARMQPLDQIVGLTIVTPDGSVVKTGAAWRRGHGGVAHGSPDPGGIFVGAQGRFGIVTEAVVTLAPAPFLAARSWYEPWHRTDELATRLRSARLALDTGTVDSLRLETVCAGRANPDATEWFVRCWAAESAEAAEQRCAAVAKRLEAREARCWVESSAARRGELPDHDERYSVPPGTHHARTGRDGFLGIEVNVNWGDQLESSLQLFVALFDTLAGLGVGHRRLGIYPAPHFVSVGIQTMLSGGEATAGAVRDALGEVVEPLSALGAVPYRAGRLWNESMGRREADDPAFAIIRRAFPEQSS